MTIRKRYDEAKQLLEIGMVEAALTIALVCLSAASERYRRHLTGGKKKQRNDDSYWFRRYADERLTMISGIPGATAALYRDLRCELMHQASTAKFHADGGWELQIAKGKIEFGSNIVSSILSAIRLDPLGREDFRDLLTPYDNLIEPNLGVEPRNLFADLVRQTGVSYGRWEMLYEIVQALQPERVLKLDETQLADEVAKVVVAFNGGAITGLRTGAVPILDAEGRLAAEGAGLLKALSEHFHTANSAQITAP